MMDEHEARRIEINGIVQGVGFRPFVYQLAHRFNLKGEVANTSAGVVVNVEGSRDNLALFAEELAEKTASVPRISSSWLFTSSPPADTRTFRLRKARGIRHVDPDLTGRLGMRRLLTGTLRPRRPPLPLPFHQLYQLRAPLYDHIRYPL